MEALTPLSRPARPRVLVVDDQPANLIALRSVLGGYDVATAGSGSAALRELLKTDFAVVILDVHMPDLDGFDTAALLRQRPRSEYTPIIFMSAVRMEPDDRERGYALGAVDYLVSPIEPDVLRAKVAVFAELNRRQREAREMAEQLARANMALSERAEELEQLNDRLLLEVADRRRAEEALVERARELEVANRDIDAFSAAAAHDLRAPVRAIAGFVGLVLEEHGKLLPPEARAALERATASTRRMSALIDGLLQIAHVSRVHTTVHPVDLGALAMEIVEELRRSSPERTVEAVVSPDLVANGDPALLRVIMVNLIDNAWKFTRQANPGRIEVGKTQCDGRTVYHVRDNGVGFDMAHAGLLFQAFTRLHAPGQFEGSGIGLATVRRIVERHDGRIWAESAIGRGATFYFTLDAS
jgi:hypothetical protein